MQNNSQGCGYEGRAHMYKNEKRIYTSGDYLPDARINSKPCAILAHIFSESVEVPFTCLTP